MSFKNTKQKCEKHRFVVCSWSCTLELLFGSSERAGGLGAHEHLHQAAPNRTQTWDQCQNPQPVVTQEAARNPFNDEPVAEVPQLNVHFLSFYILGRQILHFHCAVFGF